MEGRGKGVRTWEREAENKKKKCSKQAEKQWGIPTGSPSAVQFIRAKKGCK
jgi:hypothetical protein